MSLGFSNYDAANVVVKQSGPRIPSASTQLRVMKTVYVLSELGIVCSSFRRNCIYCGSDGGHWGGMLLLVVLRQNLAAQMYIEMSAHLSHGVFYVNFMEVLFIVLNFTL